MTDTASVLEKADELIVATEGSLGVIRLNRPKALNALTLDMVRFMSAALDRFEADASIGVILLEGAGERGLCAGGDIRGLYDSIRAGGDLGKVFWREEYILNARIASLQKPYISFMDGVVMGGGVGLSAHGAHRVVTERTQLAMPETGIGFFPDVGGTWLLSRAPAHLGTYYGLTGQSMTGMDAIRCGLADVLIPFEKLAELRQALVRLGPKANNGMVRGVMAHYALPRGPAPVDEHRKLIDASCARDSAADIVSAFERDSSEFSQSVARTLRTKSPTSLKLTLRLLREAKASTSLRQCLVREYGAALEIFISHDFPEGIRAAVIDKDKSPKWQPATLEDVTAAMIDAYFVPRGVDELAFPAGRDDMSKTVAVIGLGNMGGPMAANLIKAGHKVTGFDLVKASCDAAKADGVTIAPTAVDAVKSADVVITMLPAGKHVLTVWSEIVPAAREGALLIDCSTIDVESARKAHTQAAARKLKSIDAPVSGGVGGAKGATLTFMCGGSTEAFAAAKPVLEAMGKRIVHCGDAGAGQAAKICNNMILGISMIGVSEAFALAEKLGLSHQALFDVASTSSGQCWSITNYCPVPGPVPASPANTGYKPGFAAALMLKDLKLSQEAASAAGAATPLGKHAEEIYAAFNAAGHDGDDFSGIINHVRGLKR